MYHFYYFFYVVTEQREKVTSIYHKKTLMLQKHYKNVSTLFQAALLQFVMCREHVTYIQEL